MKENIPLTLAEAQSLDTILDKFGSVLVWLNHGDRTDKANILLMDKQSIKAEYVDGIGGLGLYEFLWSEYGTKWQLYAEPPEHEESEDEKR